MTIVVIESSDGQAPHLPQALAAEGFQVRSAAHVDEVRTAQIVLLAAPRADEAVVAAIATARRRHAGVGVMVVTDLDDLEERLACYEAGADDCLFRPFHLAEMAAKIRALQRRRTGDATIALLPAGDAVVDCGAQELRVGERAQSLTKREVELLSILSRAQGGPVDRERVLREAWGGPAWMTSNSVDVYVGYVRRKLDLLASNVTVKTVRGLGFQLASRERPRAALEDDRRKRA